MGPAHRGLCSALICTTRRGVAFRACRRALSSSSAAGTSKIRRWIMERHFEGMPTKDDFRLEEETVATDKLPDNHIVTRASDWSVDPFMRVYPKAFGFPVPMTMIGSQVSEVVESKHPEYPAGTTLVTYLGWSDGAVFNPDERQPTYGKGPNAMPGPEVAVSLPPGVSKSHLLGAVGMTGNTAYLGLLELCRPQAGQTVVVSGAAGAVGCLVGQIAKIKGCRVIGIAGSEEKCSWLTDELGFDGAVNYKKGNIRTAVHRLAPDGVDAYFDNVGGAVSYAVLTLMNMYGRVAVCGSISSYNDTADKRTLDPPLQPILVTKQIRMEGFFVWRWRQTDKWNMGLEQMAEWVADGKIKARETKVNGFENLPDAFISMLSGGNYGKMVVTSK